MAPSGKRGLCWPTDNHGKDEVFTFTKPGSRISWLYNWSPDATPNASSLDYVPMQWNHINIDDLPNKAKAANATSVMGFNEPELPDQSNMSAELAAKEWLRCIEPMRKAGVRCGSPGISSAPQGVAWLKDFLRRIQDGGSDVDFYCFHWYGVEVGQFYDYLWSTYYQMPDQRKKVWVTEWASTNWNEDNPLPKEHVEAFARESVKYLETLEWVERFAWFGPMRDTGTVGKWARMLDNDGNLTDLGKAYRDE
ncbi:hypothetical protein B0A55_05452 [Friedmanniomyces simplex]|uniref:Asl1-like glycosyl hydrolase catalytic domain-containing protein n=1 Tax=Friedmanniomyces simplex TaxID=329884 RepID=A0A4U0XD13_9PEZI|nr:hypothetical protein B0A55_05452 [Friedmanniomyces simplex]